MSGLPRAAAYATQGHDRVRAELEVPFFAGLLPVLMRSSRGGALLDLGCGEGLAARLAGARLERYTGVDMAAPGPAFPGVHVLHDLRLGLGAVGPAPFDLYFAGFGVASHLSPAALSRLLRQIARHAHRGAIVALEALGLRSLEWPQLWETSPGERRTLRYSMGADVAVHPWAPAELAGLFEAAGLSPLAAVDRTLQAGPKLGDGRYWPGLPPIRQALDRLLGGDGGARRMLLAPLAPLPAGATAAVHHRLARRRARMAAAHRGSPAELARAVWRLEPRTRAGLGHGLMLIGRVA
jgi:SAM-dependent methyltransferase